MYVFFRPCNEKDAVMCLVMLVCMVAVYCMVKGEK